MVSIADLHILSMVTSNSAAFHRYSRGGEPLVQPSYNQLGRGRVAKHSLFATSWAILKQITSVRRAISSTTRVKLPPTSILSCQSTNQRVKARLLCCKLLDALSWAVMVVLKRYTGNRVTYTVAGGIGIWLKPFFFGKYSGKTRRDYNFHLSLP